MTDFSKLDKGKAVYDDMFGACEVFETNNTHIPGRPIKILFPDGDFGWYTKDGKSNLHAIRSTLHRKRPYWLPVEDKKECPQCEGEQLAIFYEKEYEEIDCQICGGEGKVGS